jgi:OPA family sugar phosphate sensor protein UhpC-like MFS transporter
MPGMQADLGLSKFELGMLASILSLIYGASKFINGIMGDRSNPRYLMSIGLIATGIFNILFGFSSLYWTFAIFWGLNGWFQGWGWPGCAKLITHWYSQSERGRWWGSWNTCHNLGGALIPLLAAACAEYYGWRYAMYVSGSISILVGLFIMNRLRDIPQSLGLPPIEKYRNDYPNQKPIPEKSLSTKEILLKYVLGNKFIWILAVVYFLIYVIRTAINDWSMLYLIEVKNYSNMAAGFCVCWFEIGGFFGSLAAGWASDVIFKGKRNPVNILFTGAILLLVLAFKFINTTVPVFDAIFLFLFGFFIFGPQLLIGMAAVEFSHKKAAATANGFVSWIAYLGAASAGAPLGVIMRSGGWDSYIITLSVCAIFSILLLLPLWSMKANPKDLEPEPAK